MEFTPIGSISPLQSAQSTQNIIAGGEESGMFAQIFDAAIENVIQTDAQKNDLQYQLTTGQLDNPALLSIAETQAAVSVELLVELRNRTLDAYSELMRISL